LSNAASPLALYVHWPFCVSKCPYCDFNSHVRAQIDETDFITTLLADMAYEAQHTPARALESIFFGGGTPSLMQAHNVARIIEAAQSHWGFAPDIEITLEANPTSVEAARFAGFAAAGVNRVSLGIQALDDQALQRLGRPHDVRQGLAALDVAQRHFARVSCDLIYTREGQTLAAWEQELAQAIAFGTEHLSLYQLTIEPNTRFQTLHAMGALVLPDEDTAAQMFELTQAMTEAAGLPAYEISNHARSGASSRHNLLYWTYGDYIGIGPGAHGRRGGFATTRIARPESWRTAIVAQAHGMESETPLDAHTRAEEALLMGLRLTEGIDTRVFAARTGVALMDIVDQRALEQLMAGGHMSFDGTHLKASAQGRLVTNHLLGQLIA